MGPAKASGERGGRARISRRQVLGGTAAALGVAGLGSRRARAQGPTLRIAQWFHPVPAFDEWIDREFAPAWGARNGVTVTVDHLWPGDLKARAANEAALGQGHDLFGLPEAAPSLAPHAVPLTDVVAECERRFGRLVAPARKATYDPVARTFYAFCDSWAPAPLLFRTDWWSEVGVKPDTWDHLRDGARRIRQGTNAVAGFGLAPEPDSEGSLRGVLWAYGAAEQDEAGRITLSGPGAVEAVKLVGTLYRESMTLDAFAWDASSNNRAYVWGRASVIQNAVTAARSAEQLNPDVARRTSLVEPPAGPREQLAPVGFLHTYLVWKFSPRIELAKRFLVDLVSAGEAVLRASRLVSLPAFVRAVPDLRARVAADPPQPGRYALLADAERWSAAAGHPGFLTPVIEEALRRGVISRMFARAARAETTPEDAVRDADAELRRIAARWQR